MYFSGFHTLPNGNRSRKNLPMFSFYIRAIEYQDERVCSTRLGESLRFKEVLCREKITPLLVQGKHIGSQQFLGGTVHFSYQRKIG